LSYQTELQAAAAAVNWRHYFESPAVADACLIGYYVEPLIAAAAADLEGYSAGLATSAADEYQQSVEVVAAA
jgi:hypothetical protein